MEIRILGQLDGAKEAEGLTVIIDVFRAFTVECFLSDLGVAKIIPMGDAAKCLEMKRQNPDLYLVGERKGIKLDGFDSGNSPSYLTAVPELSGKTVVHSTSAGTQGIINAVHATEVLAGSLVNAQAIARYIKKQNPEIVTLVCMGLNGTQESEEDTLCANYIKALIEGKKINIHDQISDLKNTAGHKFFDRTRMEFPEPDFFMCLVPNVFDFVLKADTSKNPIEMIRIDV